MDDLEEEESPLAGNTAFSAATKLLEKRKEMLNVQTALQEKRLEFHSRLQQIKDRERQLASQRNELTDNIIELDKFIRVRR